MNEGQIQDKRLLQLIASGDERAFKITKTADAGMREKKAMPFYRGLREHSDQGATIQDKHELFPIPQSTIDVDTGAVVLQNTGY